MKVKFIGCSQDQVNYGSHDDPNGILEIGKVYSLLKVKKFALHVRYILEEFPDLGFNSACFEDIEN